MARPTPPRRALHDAGRPESARTAADRAIAIGFTGGHEVLASVARPSGWLGARILDRADMMENVTPTHRIYYHGQGRGSPRILGSVAAAQWRTPLHMTANRQSRIEHPADPCRSIGRQLSPGRHAELADRLGNGGTHSTDSRSIGQD
jgi:hypothetical protein